MIHTVESDQKYLRQKKNSSCEGKSDQVRATIALMRGNLYAGPNDNNMCSINSENLAFHEDKRGIIESKPLDYSHFLHCGNEHRIVQVVRMLLTQATE